MDDELFEVLLDDLMEVAEIRGVPQEHLSMFRDVRPDDPSAVGSMLLTFIIKTGAPLPEELWQRVQEANVYGAFDPEVAELAKLQATVHN